jgi:hypothetical protein
MQQGQARRPPGGPGARAASCAAGRAQAIAVQPGRAPSAGRSASPRSGHRRHPDGPGAQWQADPDRCGRLGALTGTYRLENTNG